MDWCAASQPTSRHSPPCGDDAPYVDPRPARAPPAPSDPRVPPLRAPIHAIEPDPLLLAHLLHHLRKRHPRRAHRRIERALDDDAPHDVAERGELGAHLAHVRAVRGLGELVCGRGGAMRAEVPPVDGRGYEQDLASAMAAEPVEWEVGGEDGCEMAQATGCTAGTSMSGDLQGKQLARFLNPASERPMSGNDGGGTRGQGRDVRYLEPTHARTNRKVRGMRMKAMMDAKSLGVQRDVLRSRRAADERRVWSSKRHVKCSARSSTWPNARCKSNSKKAGSEAGRGGEWGQCAWREM
ncbi:hypothetical protein C8F04DRAFT_1339596 [Mycena alexandri]|uniref:Uncharacterized protein n=1 Tax=Mycena alexandri TaxID=1745969 RepID=A0AAD6X480_9AGAR|nr:hypothetical protein C8F04DRAFT_1339596 [Mycena alexandri]